MPPGSRRPRRSGPPGSPSWPSRRARSGFGRCCPPSRPTGRICSTRRWPWCSRAGAGSSWTSPSSASTPTWCRRRSPTSGRTSGTSGSTPVPSSRRGRRRRGSSPSCRRAWRWSSAGTTGSGCSTRTGATGWCGCGPTSTGCWNTLAPGRSGNQRSAGPSLTCPEAHHPYGWWGDGVRMVPHQGGGGMAELEKTEKITVNIGPVDLGQIDLLVDEGFYANRTDFIRTAIRRQLETRATAADDTVPRRPLTLGSRHVSRRELEELRDSGRTIELRVLGLATVADDVPAELALATITAVEVLGAFRAPKEVKAALAGRIA